MDEKARIVVFAKAPVAGKVKTRLVPMIGEQLAVSVHREFLLHTLKTVTANSLIPVELWCAPDCEHEWFLQLQERFPTSLHRQQGRDLGERMEFALRTVLRDCNKAVIIGSDCPLLSKQHLEALFTALDMFDASVIPATDGGYVALGLRNIDHSLFEHINWGSESVFVQTLNRLDKLGWRYQTQSSLWDVDRPEDLLKLLKLMSEGKHSQAQVVRHGLDHITGIFTQGLLETLISTMRATTSAKRGFFVSTS